MSIANSGKYLLLQWNRWTSSGKWRRRDFPIQDSFSEVGGLQPPYNAGATNPAVAALESSSGTDLNNGTLDVEGYGAGESIITISDSVHQASLPVFVTTLQVIIKLENLTNAYSMVLSPAYSSPNSCGIAGFGGKTIVLPQPVPMNYTFTYTNYPSSQSIGCITANSQVYQNLPLVGLGIKVSNGNATIATAYTAVSLTPGSSNTITLSPQ